MRSVRIQPAEGGKVLLVDVVCRCGNNGLKNVATGERSFKHPVALGTEDTSVLTCERCERQYILEPQSDHIHVTTSTIP